MSEATTPSTASTPSATTPATPATVAPEPSQAARATPDAATPIAKADAASEADVAPKGKDEEDPRLASRFAALSRKEKQARELIKQAEQAAHKIKLYDDAERLAKEDPLALLGKLGLTYEQLTDFILSQDAPKDRVQTLEEKLDALEKQRADEQRKANEAAVERQINEFKRTIRATIDNAADKYELVQAEGAYDDVYDLIEQRFEQTYDRATGVGEVMPVEEAAQLVEDHLLEEARKLTKAKKLRALLGAEEPVRDTKEEKAGRDAAGPASVEDTSAAKERVPVTLTNGHVSVANPLPQGESLSREERMKRALAALRWT